MKKLICEICDATNFIKQNGVFECENCGTKYSVEEAKKITKDVNVNKPNLLEKDAEFYYSLAESYYYDGDTDDKRKAESYCNKALEIEPNNYETCFLLTKIYYDFGNKSKAELYCNKVLEIEPNNYEACFLKAKIVASQQITKTNLKEIINCFIKAITLAPNDVCEELKIDVKSVIEPLLKNFLVDSCKYFSKFSNEKSGKELQESVQTVTNVMKLCSEVGVSTGLCSSKIAFMLTYDAFVPAFVNICEEFYSLQYPNDKNFFDFINKCGACLGILETAVNYEEGDVEFNITRYKLMIDIHKKCIAAKSYEYSCDLGKYYLSKRLTEKAISSRIDIIMKCHEEIKKLDLNYEIPERPEIAELREENNYNGNNVKSGGCYIATSIYGSYDCPQVWMLRRFRDYTLAETWYGRAFIHIYYAISPTLVKYFGKQRWFKNICKKPLDYMVKNLKINGVKDTPYEDWRW